MGPQQKITFREREDLGPVLARADHLDNAIEVNARVFYNLPPMIQEFVLCHEVCHLKHHEWDEAKTNQLAAQLYMSRATDAADAETRQRFLSYLDGSSKNYSNWWQAIIAAIPAAFSLGTNIYGIVKQRNSGWYAWDRATQKSNINVMLTQAFEESRKSGSQSASQFLWVQLKNYTFKDDDLNEFLGRSENAWVKKTIAQYEKKYGFGFDEVTPMDITAYPLVVVAMLAMAGLAVYLIIKKQKK